MQLLHELHLSSESSVFLRAIDLQLGDRRKDWREAQQSSESPVLYCAYLVKLREIRETPEMVKIIDLKDFPMTDLKGPKMIKIIDFRIFRMPDLKSPKMVEMMDFRIFGRSQKPSGTGYRRKHQKRVKMVQKGTSRTTFGCYFHQI